MRLGPWHDQPSYEGWGGFAKCSLVDWPLAHWQTQAVSRWSWIFHQESARIMRRNVVAEGISKPWEMTSRRRRLEPRRLTVVFHSRVIWMKLSLLGMSARAVPKTNYYLFIIVMVQFCWLLGKKADYFFSTVLDKHFSCHTGDTLFEAINFNSRSR